ncbi:hypothetical protein AU255_06180 [Methyloprofundus sedimenti]|uniref:Alpha/beta hydrolase n=1 Tax=Methyloprofundus sedimenti TaxID=1420851 RepID=A0A1V8M7B1_9GAMM|nr:alpha/beta hydrolase [Methyloprofundus sedimenti]OQK17464.1 hypothetical protein AU255_06180 [Methyloprofundus sedimenti]
MTAILIRTIPCLLVSMAFLAGCSSSHKLMPTPNIYLQENSYPANRVPPDLQESSVDLLYVTDRAPEHNDLNELSYGAKRSASMAFGSAVVEIGDYLSWADLVKKSESEQRDSSSQLNVISRTEQGRFPETPYPFSIVDGILLNDEKVEAEHKRIATEFRKELNRRLMMSDDKTVLVFVHGFNNTFDFAASSLAEVWHFLGRQGVPILYTWPAASGGLFGYFTDRESGEFTIYHLKQLLRLLASYPEVKAINIIAHSRGTDVTTTALRELVIEAWASGHHPSQRLRIKNLVLAAPDLDLGVVQQRLMAEKFGPAIGQITIYTTQADQALGVSEALMSGVRFGRMKPTDLGQRAENIFKEVTNVSFIDVGEVKGFGHAYFRSSPATSSDLIRTLLTDDRPGELGRPLQHRQGNFWKIPKDYLLQFR